MWLRLLIILNFSFLIFNCHSYGQRPIGIAFYDVDRIYDTVPALFYDDADYTPEGRLHWTAERYARKIRNTAAVIDSMALPDRKSTRLNSSHRCTSRMPSSA